jgi:hypothetical protein
MTVVKWADELPVPSLPEDPTWRENFCFDGYDRDRDVGFWIHCGRWSKDPSIWREQVLVYWPGGDYYVNRSFGYRPSEKGPSGALLDLICEEPGKRWRIKYHGPSRRASQAEVLTGPLGEGPRELMDMDIVFTTENEMWDMTGGIDDQAWGKFHIEQTGRFQGTIKVENESVEMDGLGWHDHSRGPRDLGKQGRHAWIHGNLSKGRSFALTVIQSYDGDDLVTTLDKIVVWDGGKVFQAKCPNPPMLTSNATPAPTYDFTIEYEKGKIEVHAEAVRNLPHSTTRYMECFDGVCPGLGYIVTYEQGTVFVVDGERHNGHTERSFKL